MFAQVRYRLVLIFLLLVLLSGLFVLYGSEIRQSDAPPYGPDELASEPSEHEGERVELSGEVIDTDPIVIEADSEAGPIQVEVTDAPDATVGEELIISGKYAQEGVIEVETERALTREPWERTYMYAISVVGVGIVGLRIINDWRFSVRQVVFEPREQTLVEHYLRTGEEEPSEHVRGEQHDG